jgi:hypothetical protein
VTKRLDSGVRVQVAFSAVRDGLLSLLKERPGGRLKEALDSLSRKADLSQSELVKAARSGKGSLFSGFGSLPAQAERLTQAGDSVWMEVKILSAGYHDHRTQRHVVVRRFRGEPTRAGRASLWTPAIRVVFASWSKRCSRAVVERLSFGASSPDGQGSA